MSDSSQDVVEKIRKAEKALSSRAEVQETFAMVMQPYGNVEDLISPAPLSIALLGQLILLSLETDLSLLTKESKTPKLLTNPHSLRASLLQVSHSGWDAFSLAHKNMDAIRLKTSNIPTYVNDSVKIIVAGSKDEMQVVLPKALKNIKRISDDCTKKAKDVEERFVQVMELVSELLEYCTAKRGDHEKEIKENKAAKMAAEMARKEMEEEKKMAEDNLKESKERYNDSREDYKKAMDDMPSTASVMTLALVEKAAHTMMDAVQTVTNPFKKAARSTKNAVLNMFGTDDEEPMDTAEPELSSEDVRKLSKSINGLKDILEILQSHVQDDKAQPQEDVGLLKAKANLIGQTMKRQNKTSLLKTTHTGLEQTLKLIDDVDRSATSMSASSDSSKQFTERAQRINSKMQQLSMQLNVQSGVLPVKATPNQPTSNATGVEAMMNQSRFKCEQTTQVMKLSMKQYEEANRRTQEANRRMTELVSQISQYELKELDFETIRITLIRGIGVLSQVREQWSKLVQYFQMITNIVESSMAESLHAFIDSANSNQELKMKAVGFYTPSKAMRDVLYSQASKANQISYLVQGLSATYVEISDKHIMRPLAGLDRMMALDADRDKTKIREFQKSLKRESEDASEAIKKIVQDRHDEIMEKGYEKIANYEWVMQEALPPPTAEEKKQIQEMKEAAEKPLSEPAVDIGDW